VSNESPFAGSRGADAPSTAPAGAPPRLLPKFGGSVPEVTAPGQIFDSAVHRAVVPSPAGDVQKPAGSGVVPVVQATPTTTATKPTPPTAAPQQYVPRDDFDAMIFNLQAHGGKKE
jgi:hypothetical protein